MRDVGLGIELRLVSRGDARLRVLWSLFGVQVALGDCRYCRYMRPGENQLII